MSESKAMILGLAGQRLLPDEAAFFRDEKPWGFILFARNIGDAEQVRDLIAELRECVGRPDAPVFVDQEGGRVQRLRPPLAPDYPPARKIGAVYQVNPDLGRRAAWLQARLIAFDLERYGFSSSCLPVLDVPIAGSHNVIGDRAYAKDPWVVAALGKAAADGLAAGGILPVIKHIPGHGRGEVDSHLALPRVRAVMEELRARDFIPFRALSHLPIAMTAHVVYSAIDPQNPATTSRRVIKETIRGEIGFDGLLMSDDVSMKALSGDYSARTAAILAAGCDLVLHCNGDMDEMRAVAKETPALSGKALQRAARAMSMRRLADAIDVEAAREEFEQIMAISDVRGRRNESG